MTVLFALLAALSNSCNMVAQYAASHRAPAKVSGWRLGLYLVRNPLWLIGELALLGAFAFQAAALHLGVISVVQPLLVSELVFTVIVRKAWLRERTGREAWTGAALTALGLGLFIAMAEPRGGSTNPTSAHWLATVLSGSLVVAWLVLLGRTGAPKRRATLYGAAAGVVWAIEATFIKAMTDTLTSFGLGGLFTRWPVYAVAAGGVAGTLLVQAALHVGPLNVAQPFIVIVDPLLSIVLGLWLFGERFTRNPGEIATAVIGFVIMVFGVLRLTGTEWPELAGSATAESS